MNDCLRSKGPPIPIIGLESTAILLQTVLLPSMDVPQSSSICHSHQNKHELYTPVHVAENLKRVSLLILLAVIGDIKL